MKKKNDKYFGLSKSLIEYRLSGNEEFKHTHMDCLFVLRKEELWELIRVPFHAFISLRELKSKLIKLINEKKGVKGIFCMYNAIEKNDIWINLDKDNNFSYAIIQNNNFLSLDSKREIPKSTFSEELRLFKEILYHASILEDYEEADKLVEEFKSRFSKSKLMKIINAFN